MSEAKRKANYLYTKHSTADPADICKAENIPIRSFDMDKHFKGRCIRQYNKPIIIINTRTKHEKVRHFIIARELYYSVCTCTAGESSERNAYHFAVTLLKLMYIDEYGYAPTPNTLYQHYGVPKDSVDGYIF